MNEAWRLAASDGALLTGQIVALYGKRWIIEPSLRVTKDLRFGMGMSELRNSTARRRVHSLFRQGCMLYELIPNMKEQWLRPLFEKYAELLSQNSLFTQIFGIV